MKKLLSLLAATGLVAVSSATVVACGDNPQNKDPYEGKTVDELKIILEETKNIDKQQIPIETHKEIYDYFVSKGMEEYVIFDEKDGFDFTDEAYDDFVLKEDVTKIYNEFLIQNDLYLKIQKSYFDIMEINYRIYLLDNSWETNITTSEILIIEINKLLKSYEEGEVEGLPLHKDIRKHTDQIIARYS